MTLAYQIEPLALQLRQFRISLEFIPNGPSPVRVKMPSWTPGSYLLREYAGGLSDLTAAQSGQPISVQHESKNSFLLFFREKSGSPVSITYTVNAVDPSVRRAWISSDRGFFTGAAVFLYPENAENEDCTLRVKNKLWDCVSTSLHLISVSENTYFFRAGSYSALIDAPVLFSLKNSTVISDFSVCGTPHRLVIAGCPEADAEKITEDLKKICQEEISFWDGNSKAPFSEYVFLLSVGSRWGGLEHCESVAAEAPADTVPLRGGAVPDRYAELLSLLAHEYFHAWNVKRLKPKCFLPYDLSRENYTRLLWLFEGFTEYYQEIMLFRAGQVAEDELLKRLSSQAQSFFASTGWKHQSLSESSFDAWIKLYKPDPGSAGSSVSYYQGGAVLAFCLDLLIRRETEGRRSLDDALRELWNCSSEQGVSEDASELIRAVSVVSGTTEAEIAGILRTLADEPGFTADWSTLLSAQGLKLEADETDFEKDIFGAVLKPAEGLLRISSLHPLLPAAEAGLIDGDELIALNGFRTTKENFRKLAEQLGEKLCVTYFREGRLCSTELTLRKDQPRKRLRLKRTEETLSGVWPQKPGNSC